jgi:hypothetical protein
MALQSKGRVRASLPEHKIIPDFFTELGTPGTKYAELKMIGFDFLEPGSGPSTIDFDQYGKKIGKYDQDKIDSKLRAERDHYLKELNEFYVANANKETTKVSTVTINNDNWTRNFKSIKVSGNGYPEMVSFENSKYFKSSPYLSVNTIYSEPITDFSKMMSLNESQASDYLNEETYDQMMADQNIAMNSYQFLDHYTGGTFGSGYDEVNNVYVNVFSETLTEEQQAQFDDWKLKFERYWTSEEYHLDIWTNNNLSRLFSYRSNSFINNPNTGQFERDPQSFWSAETLIDYPIGTTPAEVFPGITDFRRLSAVQYDKQLSNIQGQVGDVIRSNEYGDNFAWHPVKNKWSIELYVRFCDLLETTRRARRDAKIKSLNEFALSVSPFTWASYHVLKHALTKAGK